MSGRIERCRALLARPGAWIEGDADGGYRLRLTPDRRRRPAAVLDEAGFRALLALGTLVARPGGGWRADVAEDRTAAGGRPGVIAGERTVMEVDGPRRLAANLGESPIAWLARRRDAAGRPWLNPREVAAGERLRADVERAARGAALTMLWDPLPRAGAGGSAPGQPGDGTLAAVRRVETALAACPPGPRAMLRAVCVAGSSLTLAERDLSLRRRQGKTVLKAGLTALADHYRIG